MAAILGVGMTLYPGLVGVDEPGSSSLARVLQNNPHIPAEKKDPRTWPEAMRLEFGDDNGLTSSIKHRQRLAAGFRTLRAEIDAFNPDFLLIWGDDQYENFREDIIPPFCVLAWDDIECQPLLKRRSNAWASRPLKCFATPAVPSRGDTWRASCWSKGLIWPTPINPCMRRMGWGMRS